MTGERNTGLDTLRGIGILTVVMVHAGIIGMTQRVLLVFILPLFYMVAGCLYRDMPSIKALAADKCRRLLIPFLFFASAGFVIYTLGNCLQPEKPFDFQLFNLLSTDRYYLPYPAALWFFWSIFWCYMFYGTARRFTRNDVQLGACCMTVGIAGWLLSRHAALPLSIDTAMSWLPFFYAGNMLARHRMGQQMLKGRYWQAGLPVAAICCTVYIAAGYRAGYCFNIFEGSIPMIMLLSLGATTGMLCVCCRLGAVPAVTYIGRNSLVIFAVHQHFIIMIREALKYIHAGDESGILNWMVAALSIAGSIFAAILLKKFAPILIGERNSRPSRCDCQASILD